METIIAYIDDAAYARQHLVPLAVHAGTPSGTHWVLVACAPRMTHRISKWVSHSARENWRAKWSEKLFADIGPWLRQRGDRTTQVLAKGPLVELSSQLMAEHATTRVLDARRPKLGQDMQPVTDAAPADDKSKPWSLPGAVTGLGMALVLSLE